MRRSLAKQSRRLQSELSTAAAFHRAGAFLKQNIYHFRRQFPSFANTQYATYIERRL